MSGSASTGPGKGESKKSRRAHERRVEAESRRKRRNRIAVVVGTAAFALVVTVALVFSSDGGEVDGVVDLEAWDLPALDGEEGERVRLADFGGTPTVVNFFASWCVQCDAELPDFRDAAVALDGEVDFVFVNANESGDHRPMVERNGIGNFPLARDVGGGDGNGLYRELRAAGMPVTAFYDSEGNLAHTVYGALQGEALTATLADLYGVSA